MTELRDLFFCEYCGQVVEIAYEGSESLKCCEKPMQKLIAKKEDSSLEKHVPYIEETEGGILVKVGQNQNHPMTEEHHIKFIEVLTKDKVCRAELSPGDEPVAKFPVKKADVILAREFCNLHKLWSN